MRFAFIQQQSPHFPVALMCRLYEVSRSGFYAWQSREPSARSQQRATLVEQIRQSHEASRQCYGSPRIHAELRAQGTRCSKNTVAKLMRTAGIRSKMQRRFVVHTTDSRHGYRTAENSLARQFEQPATNSAWAADLTYIPTAEGWLYLAVVLDLYSRKVIGWATAGHLQAELPLAALRMALRERRPTGALLHHSDRGVQYACDDYQQLLAKHGVQQSMSRRGNCYDNAVVESFFGSLKTELIHHKRYASREEARQSLFEYLEVFYNRKRRHSALGYQSPAEYEACKN
jgi:putative transposase